MVPGRGAPARFAQRLAELYEQARNPVQPAYLARKSTPGHDRERVAFINSIGGLGDSFPMPIAMQLYKRYFPADTTILYDSMFLHHYYQQPNYIDDIVRAKELIHANYAPHAVRRMDSSLPRTGGVELSDTGATKVVSTHHAHQRRFSPEEIVIKMDWASVLTDHVLQGLAPLRLQLKPHHQLHVEGLMRLFRNDGRLLIGLQNRGSCPYDSLQLDRKQYKRELESLADALVVKHNARVLLLGDLKLDSPARYAAGDWVDLDGLVRNIYYKFEIVRQCDYVFAAPSGFSMIVNMMRGPEQSPSIFLYSNERVFSSDQLNVMYPNYVADGGGKDAALITMTYQHPDLAEFLFDMPHSPAKALDFLQRLMAERSDSQAKPRCSWQVAYC